MRSWTTPFYVTGGTLRPDAPSYVERQADRDLFEGLLNSEFCYVLTARQIGKSSLMVRTANKLREQAIHVIALDLSAIGQNLTPEQWYNGLLTSVGDQLGMEDELEKFWVDNPRLSPVQRWFTAIRKAVLAWREGPVVIFLDEIDTVRSLPFSTDEFFAAIRECYNRRSEDPELNRLTFCLLGVATPSDLIRDTRITPFNIGRRIELNDFTPEEAAPLARGLRADRFSAAALLRRVLYWTSGHPYLTQRLCQALAQDLHTGRRADVDRLCEELFLTNRARERDDNLIFVRERLLRSEADVTSLLELYLNVRSDRRVTDDESHPLVSILRLSGIVRSENGRLVERNRIYYSVFDRNWVKANLPDANLRLHLVERRLAITTRIGITMTAVALVIAGAFYQAHRSSKKARQRVVQLNVAYGVRMMDQGDSIGSLLWFSKALSLVEGSPAEEEMHRYRLDAVLRQCPKLLQVCFHKGMVNDAEFSVDGRRVVTASDDYTAQVWDAVSGEPLAPPLRHEGEVSRAAFSADGRRVVTASMDGTARIWDAASGRPLTRPLPHSNSVRYAAFSGDGELIVTAGVDNAARVWNAETGEPAGAEPLRHDDWVICANFSSDGRRVVTTSKDEKAQVWEVATSRRIGLPLKHRGEIRFAQFSPDGRWVVTASQDNTARVWDAATGQPLTRPLRHVGEVRRAEFSPDGGRVVTASSDSTARVWGAVRGEPITPPLKHENDVWHAAFSPDGGRVVTASWDHTARVWDATTGEPVSPPLKHGGRVNCAAFGPDGHRIVTASVDHTARVWDVAIGQPLTRPPALKNEDKLRVFSPRSQYAAFSPDGRRFVTASFDETARVWDAATGKQVIHPLSHERFVRRAAFSPDGRRIVTASEDGTARIWDAVTGEAVTPPLRHTKEVRYAVFSPDGQRVVTASSDHTARVWNAATGEPSTPLLKHSLEVEHAAFSPDGLRVVTGCRDNTARVWSALTGEHLASLRKHSSWVRNVAFSPDGRRVVTASYDGTAQIWDAATGGPLFTLRHEHEVRHAEFSPDGRRVVTASYDGTARVWDATTGAPITPPLTHKSDVRYAAFSPDGRRVVTASKDRTARIWDAATGEPLAPSLRCDTYVSRAEFSPDGRRILTASEDHMARVWYLTQDNRPAADLSMLMQLLNGQQLDSKSDAVALEPEAMRMVWQTLKAKYPDQFAIAPAETLLWHREEAEKDEAAERWFAARFHLERLIDAQPDDQALRHRLELVRQQVGKKPESSDERSEGKAEP